MPGETRYTINKSVKLAIKLNPGVSTFHVLAPYMGTTLLNNIKNKEDINIDDFDVYTGSSSGFSCCDLSSNELKRLSNLAYLKFYLRPSYLLKLLIRLRESDFRCFVYDAILGVKEAGWVRNLLFPNLGRMRKP